MRKPKPTPKPQPPSPAQREHWLSLLVEEFARTGRVVTRGSIANVMPDTKHWITEAEIAKVRDEATARRAKQ